MSCERRPSTQFQVVTWVTRKADLLIRSFQLEHFHTLSLLATTHFSLGDVGFLFSVSHRRQTKLKRSARGQ